MPRRPITTATATGALAALALAARAALAHSPPSERTTDRYLKVTPMGDRVRLAYTVVFGQVQGAAMRRQLDRDHDGRISQAEAEALGDQLDKDVATGLHLALDGHELRWDWARVDVGLGTDRVAAGALSVDLIAWLCTGGGRGHTLLVRDDVRLAELGLTELTIDVGPGVTVGKAVLGGDPLGDTVASWTGAGGPLATGLELPYTVDARAARPRDGRCAADATGGSGRGAWYAAAAGLLALAGGAVAWRRLRPRRGP